MAAADTVATGGQRQPKNVPVQDMTTPRLACLVAFLLLGPLETSAKSRETTHAIRVAVCDKCCTANVSSMVADR